MSSSTRHRRTCRNRALSQPIRPAIASPQQLSTLRTQNVSHSLPIVVQPSPRVSSRSQSRLTHQRPEFLSSVPLTSSTDNPNDFPEQIICPLCAVEVDDSGLCCDRCNTWFHTICVNITEDEYNNLSESSANWFCDYCKSISANRIRWGTMEGEENIQAEVSKAYKEVIGWKKNIFLPPRGKAGSDLIKELTRLINLFVHKTNWERLALPLVHVFLPLMLQKPSKTSKAKDHAKYLLSRLEKWKAGGLEELLEEGKAIQKRIAANKKHKIESNRKAFCRLMLAGKLKQALGFINNDTDVKGVHTCNDEIKNILHTKHPRSEPALPEALLPLSDSVVQNVIFEDISGELVQKCGKNLHGSGGPTQIDSEIWKHILCSRSYGREPYNLAEGIAALAKRLCCEEIHPRCLREFTASRLIPLDKGIDSDGNPGVRPIGIGEVLRRIVSKSVLSLLKSDVQNAAGTLQTCTGLKSGIEAAIHTANTVWHEDTTEAVLFVDADNAFNRLNRKAALHNVQQLCPPLFRFLMNHYQSSADLVVPNSHSGPVLLSSEEACTQDDVLAVIQVCSWCYTLG